jgi:RecA/RadA recombinase
VNIICVGVMFGNPEVTSGGNALKFYSSVRIDIRKIETLKDNTGVRARTKIVKNKVIIVTIMIKLAKLHHLVYPGCTSI